MKIQRKDGASSQECGDDQAPRADGKKKYEPPHLLEWGSLTELTSGKLAQNQDAPFKGGTRQV